METSLFADVALVHAFKGDEEGNLVYRKTARNFNPIMATAARLTVAEVEHLVPNGGIDPDAVHTSGIFIQKIVHPGAIFLCRCISMRQLYVHKSAITRGRTYR